MAGVIPHQQSPCFHDHNNSAFIILALCIQQTQLGPWCRSKELNKDELAGFCLCSSEEQMSINM